MQENLKLFGRGCKVHVWNPWAHVPFSVQIHILSKGGDHCLYFNKALGDAVGSTSYSTAPQLREIRDKACPEKTKEGIFHLSREYLILTTVWWKEMLWNLKAINAGGRCLTEVSPSATELK